ncbi:MAG TPA: DUF669 domain-containing protein [Planctomycetota bacterium]|nr:DUF669 domain-containing protein [Planctomycetota bacterium]
MANLGNFNAHEVEPTTPFDPIPAGKYLACVSASTMKPTKDNTGSFLELEFTIMDGEYRGRKVWDRLCLSHPNQQTVTIARGNLSALCRAVNVMQPRDSFELHNLPLTITVKCKKREDTGDIVNEVKGYAKRETAAGQPQQAQNSTPPWKR